MKELFLITGGAGFIGSNFVRHVLTHTKAGVVVLDKLTYAGSLANLEGLPDESRFEFVRGDIADAGLVRDLFESKKPSAVINFAAESHVDRSIDGPRDFLETNVVGTFVLLEAAREYLASRGPELKETFRFLQVSTDEIYGSLGETGFFTEETPVAPNSPYSASKAAADHFARAYHRTYGVPTIITNCSNNYGPYQFPEKLIPLMVLNAMEGKKLPIYGDGSNIRDWIYVEDHCEGVLRVLERGRVGERYNLGGRCECTNLELIDRICAILEELRPAAANPKLGEQDLGEYQQLKSFVTDRPGHDRRYAIDIGKVESELDWRPTHTLDEGLRQTVKWYLENLDWCDKVQSGGYRRQRLGLGLASKK